jgi:tetratricopeptide (TPR) repeat protein
MKSWHGGHEPKRAAAPRRMFLLAAGALAILSLTPGARAAELDQATSQFLKGQYAEAARSAAEALAEGEHKEDWALLLVESLKAQGHYTNAYAAAKTNIQRFSSSIRLRLLARELAYYDHQEDEAKQWLSEVRSLGGYRMWAYQDAANLTTLGQAAVFFGADPRRVLEQFLDRARRADPERREPYLAAGQLALDKGDFATAAKSFSDGLKKLPDDADLHHGLARSFAPSSRAEMLESIDRALEANSNHVASYVLVADHLIDGEDYAAATKALDRALRVNPWDPEAWAYRTVIAHLRNDAAEESAARANALRFWKSNPQVDHLIGRKLSQKYRFAEGAVCQRRALRFDPKFLPSRIQLAQDLLRLGQEEEGWQLAAGVHADDGYDVTAFNLVTLQEHMEKFTALTNRDFILRMATNEAAVYGPRALALLQRARDTLCARYGLELATPTVVEIFPEQKDFGVRTFGMPDNPGFLGVCFGPVITANSPASQGAHPENWEAVLWHEFCHVVTLGLTRNKMPRWLSEGISVYEELQANPAWGQRMNPRYREMILGEDFVPIGKLSAAFLTAKSDQHLQFAYYQSALAIEFLVGRFGHAALKAILREVGEGGEINATIAKHTAPLDDLEPDFATFARQRAQHYAPELDFEKPRAADRERIEANPLAGASKNFYTLTRLAKRHLEEKEWAKARAPLEKLLQYCPDYTGPDNAYSLMAEAHRGLGETNQERAVLARLAGLESDAIDAYARLAELAEATGDWPAVVTNVQRHLAVNPLAPLPYRRLARAQEALERVPEAIAASRTLLLLDPPDPAGAQFQLARLLHATGQRAEAKQHLLRALEEAPRFREGHKLLLQLATDTRATNGIPEVQQPAKP